jgi:FkbM family methyltransferase
VSNDVLPDAGTRAPADHPVLLRSVNGRHGHLAFFANDVGAASRALARYGEWAENEISFVRQFIQPGSVVLDIGAYVGTHTLAFARAVGAGGLVIAFEAQPETFDLLKRNVSANHLENVRLENMAVGDGAGVATIPLIDASRPESFGSMSLRGRMRPGTGTAEAAPTTAEGEGQVRHASIDSLGLDACAVMKIDAEGMEHEIIRGAAETIRRLRPIIYAECNSIADGLLTLEQFQRLDYVARLHVVDAFDPANFFGVSEDIFGGGREAALVGVHASEAHRLDGIAARPCELLLRVQSADDLVLGLLNKPQYVEEVLVPSAAAGSGGNAWIDALRATKAAREKAENELAWAKTALAEEQARLDRTTEALTGELRSVHARIDAEMAGVKGMIVDERARADQLAASFVADLRATRERIDEAAASARAALADERARNDQIAHVAVEAQRELRDTLRETRDHFGAELAAARAAIAEDRSRSAESTRVLTEELAALRARVAHTAAGLDMHNADMANQLAMFEAAMRQARFARDTADTALRDAKVARDDAASAERARHDAEATREAVARHAEALAGRLTQAETMLNAVYASTSWRLTRPLRWAVERVRPRR